MVDPKRLNGDSGSLIIEFLTTFFNRRVVAIYASDANRMYPLYGIIRAVIKWCSILKYLFFLYKNRNLIENHLLLISHYLMRAKYM